MVTDIVDTQVVVVGAGPVGLMLAGELRLGGADVIVLEQLEAPTAQSRASTLHARTMEILDSRGLLDVLGTPPNEPRGHFGGLPLDLVLPTTHPGQWKVPQTRTEELLLRWARDLGADVRRGHRLCGLAVRPGHVEAEVAGPRGPLLLRGRYLVGCDGERSTVRALARTGFPGQDAVRELLRADVAGIDVPDRRFQRLARGLAIAARRADGVTRVMVHEFGRAAAPRTAAPEFTEVAEVWKRVTGEDISAGTPLWVNAFGDANRQADRYRDGRVLLAGDAAHEQMPVGGQALNLGLQDAVNLGWKLALHVGGRASPGLLDSYQSERHAVGRRVLSHIKAQAMLLLGGPEVEAVRTVFGELLAEPGVREHLAGTITGLDTRYDVGEGDHPLLGARLPPAPLATRDGAVTTAALLRPGQGVLLDLSADDAHHGRLQEHAAPWKDRVTVVAARPAVGAAGGHLAGTGSLLVRPDGHVAWAGPGTGGLPDALLRWFGPPDAQPPRLTVPARAPAASAADRTTAAEPRTATEPKSATEQKTATERKRTMSTLKGKTALVTGSSRGMGRATARRLAADGALVCVHYATSADAAAEVVATIEKDGGRAFAVGAELGVKGDVHELFLGLEDGLRERTGSTQLDILVNNAGVMGGVAVEATTAETFDRLFAVNAKAPFFIIQRALRHMRDGGRIINISSGLTRFANPDEIAYAMTKGAVEQLALHFAKYLGPRGITVNSVAPGITRNDNPVFGISEAVEQMAGMSAFNRVGEPEDVAEVVAFLASDEARWITGSFVDATGGTLLG